MFRLRSVAVLFIALVAVVFSASIQTASAASLNVVDAWLRIPPPGTEMAAVYFTLRNVSPHTVMVEGAEAPDARMAMIHESKVVNGKAQMRMRDNVVLAPGQTVTFAPNGLHLMLHGVHRKLLVGEKLPVMLLLSGGEKIAFTATVRPLTQ